MHQVKTFRAANMQEALDVVRNELGPDAVILHTKQLSSRRLLPWKKATGEVEITAGVENRKTPTQVAQSVAAAYKTEPETSAVENRREQKTSSKKKRPPKVQAELGSRTSRALELLNQIGQEDDELELSDQLRKRGVLESKPAEQKRTAQRPPRTIAQPTQTQAEPPTPKTSQPERESFLTRPLQKRPAKLDQTSNALPQTERLKKTEGLASSQPVKEKRVQQKRTERPQSMAARMTSGESTNTGEANTGQTKPNRNRSVARTANQPETARSVRNEPQVSATRIPAEENNFATRLANIEKMLLHLGRQNPAVTLQELPDALFHTYTELIDADVAEEVARELVFELKKQCRPQDLEETSRSRTLLDGLVENQFDCAGPIEVTPGRRKVVALVGATGVGKTTTIAKLAANFKLRQGIKIGLVTVDTYRIAAVEQLRTYAEIMEIPMKVVTNSTEMRHALDELHGLDLVLIDTGGRSPKDELKINELKLLLQEARADEVHLVMNLTANLRNLESTATAFSSAGTTSMILTKLDEAEGLGSMLSLARKVSLPVSYLTTGQAVPEDIEASNPSRMRRLLFGEETVTYRE